MSFAGVLFDLDGVITDTAHYHYLAWKALAKTLDIEVDIAFNEQLKGVSRIESLKRILAHGGKLDAYTPKQIESLAAQKNEHYQQLIKDISPADVFPGILALLKELKAAGKKIALASASKNGPTLLQQLGIAEYFDAIADAGAAASKPEPDIFLAAARDVGLTAEECIGIEDAPAGVEAIRRANAVPVGVGRTEDLGKDLPVVASTKELSLAFLEKVWKEARTPCACACASNK